MRSSGSRQYLIDLVINHCSAFSDQIQPLKSRQYASEFPPGLITALEALNGEIKLKLDSLKLEETGRRQAMVEKAIIVTSADFFTGLFAALALKSSPGISMREGRLDRAIAPVFEEFLKRSVAENLDVQFRIRLHPFHQDSIIVRNAICDAAQRYLISLDNPEFQDIRLKLTKDEANEILSTLPGSKELFLKLADRFLDVYETRGNVSLSQPWR